MRKGSEYGEPSELELAYWNRFGMPPDEYDEVGYEGMSDKKYIKYIKKALKTNEEFPIAMVGRKKYLKMLDEGYYF